MTSAVEQKLAGMGITLRTPPPPSSNYALGVQVGRLVFLAGSVPRRADGTQVVGRLGSDLTLEQGYEAARLCAIDMLSNLKAVIGDLDKVQRIVRVFGMVMA